MRAAGKGPEEGESFDAYWLRMGFEPGEIDEACEGLSDRALDVANDRLASLMRRRCPEAFTRYVDAYARAAGVDPSARMRENGQVVRITPL